MQGGGGSVAESGRPQIQIFIKIFEVEIVSCVLEDNIRLINKSFKFMADVSELFLVRSNSL